MSKMTDEIFNCMSDLKRSEEGKITAHFVFPPAFVGFDGHFPDRPILPGVCKIQAAIIMLETLYKKKITLKEITLAKYFKPVSCNETLYFECTEKIIEHERYLHVYASNQSEKVAKLQLKMASE